MRRLSLCAPFVFLLLCSCGGGVPTATEVLQRAVTASRHLKSVRFEATCDVRTGTERGGGATCALRDGVMQDQGKQMRFSLDLRKEGGAQNGLSIDVMSGGPDETYVRPTALSGSGDLSALLNAWWKLPAGSGSSAPLSVTPDPRLLRAQAEAVSLVRDRGRELLDGRPVYDLDVALDPAKLVALRQADAAQRGAPFDESGVRLFLAQYDVKGEVWIDASTFVIRRLQWSILPRESGESWRFDVRFSDHDDAPDILPPAEAKPLPPSLMNAGYNVLSSFFPHAASEERFFSSGSGITIFLQ